MLVYSQTAGPYLYPSTICWGCGQNKRNVTDFDKLKIEIILVKIELKLICGQGDISKRICGIWYDHRVVDASIKIIFSSLYNRRENCI